MKKKVRNEPAVPFYSTEPQVSRIQVAEKPLVPSAGLANDVPSTVPKQPARFSGLASFASKKQPRAAAPRSLRLSGHSGAHRIGKR